MAKFHSAVSTAFHFHFWSLPSAAIRGWQVVGTSCQLAHNSIRRFVCILWVKTKANVGIFHNVMFERTGDPKNQRTSHSSAYSLACGTFLWRGIATLKNLLAAARHFERVVWNLNLITLLTFFLNEKKWCDDLTFYQTWPNRVQIPPWKNALVW